MKHRFLLILACIAVFGVATRLHAVEYDRPTMITGKVLGSDGKPMKLAHVFTAQYNTMHEKPKMYNVKADGSYTILLPPGWYQMEFSGVDHQREQTPTWVYCAGGNMQIDAYLQANSIQGTIDSVVVITEDDNYAFDKTHRMTKAADGTYGIDLTTKSDGIGYQVVVYSSMTAEPHSINGTMAEGYEYDGGGDYRSLVPCENKKVHIVFDPRRMMNLRDTAAIFFRDRFSKTVSEIYDEQQQVWATYYAELAKKQAGMEYHYDVLKMRADLRKRIGAEKDPTIRQILMLSYLGVPTFSKDSTCVDSKFVDQIFQTIAPSSPLWTIYPNVLCEGVKLSSKPDDSYIKRVIEDHANTGLKAQLLYNQIADLHEQKKFDEAAPLYEKLTKDYAETFQAKQALKELRPNRKIMVGNPIPDFAFQTLDDSTISYVPATLKGRYVLIDNWATWCGPCVREMQTLHDAYEKFKDKKFTILSVSYDKEIADIAKFRKGKWPMPWLHCFSPGVWQNEAAKIFEVSGIPKPILIDPNGKIIALDNECRGTNLIPTLEKFIK